MNSFANSVVKDRWSPDSGSAMVNEVRPHTLSFHGTAIGYPIESRERWKGSIWPYVALTNAPEEVSQWRWSDAVSYLKDDRR